MDDVGPRWHIGAGGVHVGIEQAVADVLAERGEISKVPADVIGPCVCEPPCAPVEIRPASPRDTRRRVNAALHVAQLQAGRLTLHGAVVARGGRGVLLLGDHGAGKTLVSLALAEQGGALVAADAAVVGTDNVPLLVAGTRAVLARPHRVAAAGDRNLVALASPPTPTQPIEIVGAAFVHVSQGTSAAHELLAAEDNELLNRLLRSSGYHLHRVLDGGVPVSNPDGDELHRRADRCRALARRISFITAAGNATSVAEAIASYFFPRPRSRIGQPTDVVHPPRMKRAAVVGFGYAGRLHAALIRTLADEVVVIDPYADVDASFPRFDEPRDAVDATGPADLWVVCTPTERHVDDVEAILATADDAVILLEKPACVSGQLDRLLQVVTSHPRATVVVNDEYRSSHAVSELVRLVHDFASGQPVEHVRIEFSKNRLKDIAAGRFVDKDFGVMGYEWPHMLTVLRQVIGGAAFRRYLDSNPDITPTFIEGLGLAAMETSTRVPDGPMVWLRSSIMGSLMQFDEREPQSYAGWERTSSTPTRYRVAEVVAGELRFLLHLEPVHLPSGSRLRRLEHRITIRRGSEEVYESLIFDSHLGRSLLETWSEMRELPAAFVRLGDDVVSHLGTMAARARATAPPGPGS